jgi:predicted Fe-S protein YdhL (DUF1289 family)
MMVQFQEGMTKIWNRLHDPHEDHPGIERLRVLRDDMDRAVLDAYGWSELSPYDKEPILRRLRKLNAQRAREEAAQAAESGKSSKSRSRKKP